MSWSQPEASALEEASRALAFEHSPVPLFLVRERDGAVLAANEAFCEALTCSSHDLDGQSIEALGVAVDRLRQITGSRSMQLTGPRGAASIRFSVQARSLRIDEEACLCCTALAPCQADEAEIAHLRASLLTNLTHEVRTPLTVILGFTSILREGVQTRYSRFVDLIERSGRRLLLLLDALLDLASIESGTLAIQAQRLNLNGLVESVAAETQSMLRTKGLDLVFDLPSQCVSVQTDEAVLSRVLANILDNAIKFTDAGKVHVRLTVEGEEARITVEDTGIGIDEAFLPKLFEEFEQESQGLARDFQGAGLGLSVSQRLVQHLGGRIEVESAKGQGSRFTIVLPRVVEPGDDGTARRATGVAARQEA